VSGRGLRLWLCAGLALAIWLPAGTARASTVLLIEPADPAGAVAEALVRVRGELAAAGFKVESVAAPPSADARAALERAANGRTADAVVAILGEDWPDSVEIWVLDRVTGKSLVRRTPLEPKSGQVAEIMAVRAIELLRASFLEVDMARAGRRSPVSQSPPAQVARFVEGAVESRREPRWGLEVGGSVLASFAGAKPAVLPTLALDLAIVPWFIARASAAGLGTRAHVSATTGSAEVAQQMGLVAIEFRWRASKTLRPSLSLGAGALHTAAEGSGAWPYQGQTAERWSFVADAGAGVRLGLHSRYELAASLHVQMAHPYPSVRFLGQEVATLARPSLWFTLALAAWL